MYINLATGVGMEEKSDVAYAHKKVLQGQKYFMNVQDTILRVLDTFWDRIICLTL